MGKKRICLFLIVCAVFCCCVKRDTYREAIRWGGEWFLNNQNETFLYYEYIPMQKTHPGTSDPLREMASLWSIGRLACFLGDSSYSTLAHKGFDYFNRYFIRDSLNGFLSVRMQDGRALLGFSAFMVLSLLESDYPAKDSLLKEFAQGMLFLQQPDGSFKTDFYSDITLGADYYPGEALLALMSLYEYANDGKYLDAVLRAFPYYSKYWQRNPNLAFVPWQTQAYYKAYKAGQRPGLKEYIYSMNDYIIRKHARDGNASLFDFSAGIETAVYIEGMNKACALAQETGDRDRYEKYGRFIRKGCDYILNLQITPSNSFGWKFEKEALGGFINCGADARMRVDQNQHAVCALMEATRLGFLK